MKSVLVIAFAVLVATFIGAVTSSDEITSLPGLNTTLPFKHYSGYLTVDSTKGRNLFYWYTEAETNPSTAPLILWLNGG